MRRNKLENIGTHKPGVYAIINHSKHKCYIGQTADLQNRLSTHISRLEAGKHYCKEMQDDYKKNDDFEIIILAEMKEHSDSRKCLEDYYITCLRKRDVDLYNNLHKANSKENFFYRASHVDEKIRNLISKIY